MSNSGARRLFIARAYLLLWAIMLVMALYQPAGGPFGGSAVFYFAREQSSPGTLIKGSLDWTSRQGMDRPRDRFRRAAALVLTSRLPDEL
jgi:hypothetical protein